MAGTTVRPVAVPRRPSTGTPRHVLSATDLVGIGLDRLLDRAEALKSDRMLGRREPRLAGRQVALLFEKPSLRTRVSFDVGVDLLGGHTIYLGPEEVGLASRETPTDVGRNLSRWVDAIVVRTFAHATLSELAVASSVPVVNALTDAEHPCQALADLLTLRQHLGLLAGRRLTYVGDGNNVCHSLLLAAAAAGMHGWVATPPGYAPNSSIVADARRLALAGGGTVTTGHDPREAVAGADAVYTDVWTSMGREAEAEVRRRDFAGFQVNAELLVSAPDALVMHCLPAHRGEEITDEVLDGPRSVALD